MDLLVEKLPELYLKTLEHLVLTGVSTGVAVIIGLPLGVLIRRLARLRGIVLGVVGTLQTIPSLALLAFLLPFLGIGTRPALVALTLYAILPILRNTYTGLCEVPSDAVEAATGLGFTATQRLLLVEIPLALPMIVAGIRTATVIGVGIATLSAFIGAGGLGDFINRGLALSNTGLILLGAIPAAILALVLDFAVGLVESLLRPGRLPAAVKKRAVIFTGGVVIIGLALLWGHYSAGNPRDSSEQQHVIRVGSKNFTEQLILGEIMAQRIEAATKGKVDRRFNLGGTILCHRALVNGDIDLYAEYTGTALMAILGRDKTGTKQEQYDAVTSAYRDRFHCQWLLPFGFNNTYAITVRRSEAEEKGWVKISDLSDKARDLRAGFTAEFEERPDGYPMFREAYGFRFGKVFDLDPGLMYRAALRAEVDVICAFATDGRIEANDLLVLEDDRDFFPAYFAAPVVRFHALDTHPDLRGALLSLSGAISDKAMQRLNLEVDVKGRSPAEVAREFLLNNHLLP